MAELDLVSLEEKALKILRQGDPTNGRRSDLAIELGKRGAGDRYAAFLEILPSVIAREARGAYRRAAPACASRLMPGPASWSPSRRGCRSIPPSTVFQLGGILASVADPVP